MNLLSHLHAPHSAAMARRDWLRLSTAGAVTALTALAAPAQTAPPRSKPRLVTVGGALTEVVYLLGAQAQLVGTDSTSLYPPAAQQTPKVGYMRQLSAEGLLSLAPDAVIATTEAGPAVVLDQVRAAGVRVELIESDHSWAEVQRKVAAVGRAANRVAQAAALQAQLDNDWALVLAQGSRRDTKKPRVLFLLAHGASPQMAGEQTAADAMIRFMGGVNVMRGFSGYRAMTAEAMASAAPELILTTTQGVTALGGVDKLWARPELALTPAYRLRAQANALLHLDALELLGFGPRLPGTVRELQRRMTQA